MQCERQTFLTKEANSAFQRIFNSLILKGKNQRQRQNYLLLLIPKTPEIPAKALKGMDN